jgi:ABC-type transporter Mla maintaining outer membrane lipid asymmetry ATPase subunit MlaF
VSVSLPADDILVDLNGVDFAYDTRPILSGINLRIPRGKLVAIMGGSGCGKTTTLRLIGGQLKPTSGDVIGRWGICQRCRDRACMRCGAAWACCSSSARCLPT